MNRMDEYTALLAELEQTPEELDNTVNKALNRKNALQKKTLLCHTAEECFLVSYTLNRISA